MAKSERPGVCEDLRRLHHGIEEELPRLSALLGAARRDSPVLEDLLDLLAGLHSKLMLSADLASAHLFPALEPWLGGANGPLARAGLAHAKLRLRFRQYWAGTERLLFAPQSDRAERRILVQKGHELIEAIEEVLGLEDEYIFRVAEKVLDPASAAGVGERIRAELQGAAGKETAARLTRPAPKPER